MAQSKFISQQLNAAILPPGTSPAFKDWLIKLNQMSADAGKTAEGSGQNADDALKVANEQKLRNDQQDQTLADQAGQISTMGAAIQALTGEVGEVGTNAVSKTQSTLQVMSGPLSVGTELRINNIKVLGGRQTGWTSPTGTLKKGAINGSASYSAGATYSQAEIQALADGLVEARQVIAALVALAMSHGLAGADPAP